MKYIYKIYNIKHKIFYDSKGQMMSHAGHKYSENGQIFTTLKNAKIARSFNKLKDCVIYEYPLTEFNIIE